jgi:hypothetical protein
VKEILFTPAALLDLLTQIDELQDYNITVTESIDGDVQLHIGESVYSISGDDATEVDVDESVVQDIAEINLEAYDSLEASGDIDLGEPVESGILKTLGKALAIGGLVMIGGKLLKTL